MGAKEARLLVGSVSHRGANCHCAMCACACPHDPACSPYNIMPHAGKGQHGGKDKKHKKSPWREGKGPKKGSVDGSGGFKKGGSFRKQNRPGSNEASRNQTFFEMRKMGKKNKGQDEGGKDGQRFAGGGGMSEVICMCCREKGHLAKHCPKNPDNQCKVVGGSKFVAKQDATRKGRCYNCGEIGHNIHNCPKPKKTGGKLEFATCFVCGETGHISSQCPKNERGIYPRGGCCKICQSVRHLAKDCPERGTAKDKKASEMGGGVRKDKLADDVSGNACFELTLKGEGAHGRGAGESAQEDAGQEAASMNKPAKKHKKIVKF